MDTLVRSFGSLSNGSETNKPNESDEFIFKSSNQWAAQHWAKIETSTSISFSQQSFLCENYSVINWKTCFVYSFCHFKCTFYAWPSIRESCITGYGYMRKQQKRSNICLLVLSLENVSKGHKKPVVKSTFSSIPPRSPGIPGGLSGGGFSGGFPLWCFPSCFGWRFLLCCFLSAVALWVSQVLEQHLCHQLVLCWNGEILQYNSVHSPHLVYTPGP